MSKSPKYHHEPPKLATRFLHWYCRRDLVDEVEGDLYELFQRRVEEQGIWKAKILYWLNVILFLHPDHIQKRKESYTLNHTDMFRNYFKIGWRNILKRKGYSFINIGGLAVGMSVAILIGLWSNDELFFNKYHENYDRIAWVMQNQTFEGGEIQTWQSQALPLAQELRNTYGSNFKYVSMASFVRDYTLLHEEKALTKSGIFMEKQAPEMLTLRMLKGTRQGLEDPSSILLSESTANAFFGDEDPINKVIQINDWFEVQVTGVYEDLPDNTSFSNVSFISSWELYAKGLPDYLNWGNSWFQTIVQIANHAKMAEVSALIKDAKKNRITKDEGARFNPELFLHPMSKIYLYSDFEQGEVVGGRIQYVWLFGIIGVFVLLLACINFMNLSTARSEKRAKEVGVRKAIGSARSQLVHLFFTESILIAILAFILAVLAIQLMLPPFNEVADKEISILWTNPWFWLLGVGFALFTGILSGSYPALYLSSLRAVSVLKGTFRVGRMATIPRKVLVVVQFTVSITLIIGTIIIFQQIQFVKNRPVGYDRSNLISVPIKSAEIHQHYEAFRNDLLQSGVVEEVAKSESPITNASTTNSGMDWRGKDPGMQDQFVTMRISHEFGKTVNWQIVEGRDFSRDLASDSLGFVINEAAAEYMGLENPIGEQVKWGENGTYTIIGVVKDMITQSPYAPVEQMIFFIDYDRSNIVNIKLKPDTNTGTALVEIEGVFQKYDPVNPFDYNFADSEYAKKFGQEERVGKLAGFFAILAILISCLGLFGLAAYVAEQRTKEIGIRKVLGASVNQLWQLLSKDFMVLVTLSCGFAAPVAYYFLYDWLQNYEYRTDISWWIFAIAGLGALLITLLTVSFQTIKAAIANPVDSLRNE